MVAEGLETAEQLAQLREIGCDMAQGYYLSKPLTEEAAALLVADPEGSFLRTIVAVVYPAL